MRAAFHSVFVVLLASATVGCRPSAGPSTRQGEADDPASVPGASAAASPIAVSNSYLAAALRDLSGENLPLVLLAKPGSCPGHFDLRPSQARQLRSCGLLARFDFQGSLDSWLDGGDGGPRVVAVSVPGGMCEPESYQAVCRQLAAALVDSGRLSREEAGAKQAAISERMDRLGQWARGQLTAAAIAGAPVLSSGHQAEFCRALGLNVAATFSAADTASPGQIDQAIQAGQRAGVKLIIANLPEGRQLADALADRLGARVVVFDNFPEEQGYEAFDEMVRWNVTSLITAAKP